MNTGYNIFCSGLAHLPDGSIFAAGGNKDAQLNGIVQTHTFNPTTNTWSLGPDMAVGRWYPTVTPLRNGEMLITEGGPDMPEVRTTAGGLRALTTASLNLPLYPWLDVAPDGRAFYSGPDQTMRSLDTTGGGAWQTFGQRDALNRSYGSHALYDVGKILVDRRRRVDHRRAGHRHQRRDAPGDRDRADGHRPAPAQPHGARRRDRCSRRAATRRARRSSTSNERRLSRGAVEPGHRASGRRSRRCR